MGKQLTIDLDSRNRPVFGSKRIKAIAPEICSAEEFKNGLTDVVSGLMSQTTGMFGIPFGTAQVSQVDTFFKNNRWYFISNMRQVLSEIYVEHGIIQTLVDIPVDDAFRGGFDIKTEQLDENQIDDLLVFLERNRVYGSITQALKWARLFGGGGILIITDQDPTTELDIEAVKEDSPLKFKAVDLWELYYDTTNLDNDWYDGNYVDKKPEFYSYYGHKVHKSRVIRIEGKTAPSLLRPKLRGWGFSVIESVVRSYNQYLKSVGLTFEVLDEFKVDVFKIANFTSSLQSGKGSADTLKRLQLANAMKNYQNALVMDSLDGYENKQLTFSGISDIQREIRIQIASELRIPPIKLFGVAGTSSGLATTSADELEIYNSMIETEIRSKVKYDILRTLEICCQKQFGFIPDDLKVEFKPLRILSAEQEENIKNQKFQRVSLAMQSGLISAKEAKQSINKENLLPVKIDESDELSSVMKDSGLMGGDRTPDIHLDTTPKANSKGWFSKIKGFFNNNYREEDHKRGKDGRWEEGGGGGANTPMGKISKTEENKQKIISELDTKLVSEVRQLFDEAKNNIDTDKYKEITIRTIDNDEADRVKKATGIDISGKEQKLTKSDIRHIYIQHGNPTKEAKRGQIAITADDLLLIPHITKNFDSVSLELEKSESRNVLKYKKKIEGTYYFYETVGKDLRPKTFYKQKK
ncbi:MAG: DUF1073 domain-containing protein [Elusimicrobiota bacterium]|jgi:phage-related protein (TIGR01555 family)|nr:DUF1073 domain-containing protein [Elusimicrobiota bacterium]